MSEITTVLPHRPTTPIFDDGPKGTYAFMFQELTLHGHCAIEVLFSENEIKVREQSTAAEQHEVAATSERTAVIYDLQVNM